MSADAPAVRRRVRDAGSSSKFTGLGIRAAAVLLKHASFDTASGVGAMRRPLDALADTFAELGPLELFSEWSPPRDPALVRVALAATATASVQKSTEFEASMALQDEAQTSWQSGSTKSAWWSVGLVDSSSLLASVRVTFRPTQLPESVTLEIAKGSSTSPTWSPVATVSGKAVRELTVLEPPELVSASQVRLSSTSTTTGTAKPCCDSPLADSAAALRSQRVPELRRGGRWHRVGRGSWPSSATQGGSDSTAASSVKR